MQASDIALQFEILWPALCAGMLVLATHIPLGHEVLKRGIIFLDLAIAQTAAFGVVLASTFSSHAHSPLEITAIAIAAASLGAAVLYQIRNFEVRLQESMIGILFVLMATGVILVLSKDPHGGERLKEMLVGQILWLQVSDLMRLLVVYGILGLVWLISPKSCRHWLFYPTFAVAITVSTQFVGVYLVFASLIVPTIATLQHPNPLMRSGILGFAGYLLGLTSAAIYDTPAGATIVWSMVAVAGLYAIYQWTFKRLSLSSHQSHRQSEEG